MKEKVSGVVAIKRFFERDGGQKVSMEELKKLSHEDRDELAPLCAEAIGVELKTDNDKQQ
jgi:hypothetical protein